MRENRQFEVGNIYHVFNRGVDKRTIFQKDQDYYRFILGLYYYNRSDPGPSIWTNINTRPEKVFLPLSPSIAVSDTAMLGDSRPIVEVLAFCLMSNHYHLILREIRNGGISLFMQKMGGYSRYFNKQYSRTGALFQGKYKAVHIKDDRQLLTIFNYVHTNPVEFVEPRWKDLMVENKENAINYLNSYKWSSYHDYAGYSTFPLITYRDFFFDFFGGVAGCKQAVEDWINFKAENVGIDEYLLKL